MLTGMLARSGAAVARAWMSIGAVPPRRAVSGRSTCGNTRTSTIRASRPTMIDRFNGRNVHRDMPKTVPRNRVRLKLHQRATRPLALIVMGQGEKKIRLPLSHRPQHDHAGVILKVPATVHRCSLDQQSFKIARSRPPVLLRNSNQAIFPKRLFVMVAGFHQAI